MALILMVSRLALVVQYGSVLFYVRGYHKTKLPLLLTMATLFLASMGYLLTFFYFTNPGVSFPIQHNGPQTYMIWYAEIRQYRHHSF